MEIHKCIVALLALLVGVVGAAVAAAEGPIAVRQSVYLHHTEFLVTSRAPVRLEIKRKKRICVERLFAYESRTNQPAEPHSGFEFDPNI